MVPTLVGVLRQEAHHSLQELPEERGAIVHDPGRTGNDSRANHTKQADASSVNQMPRV